VNGIAHVILTVSDWNKSSPFYKQIFTYLGFSCVFDLTSGYGDGPFLYFVGGRTAVGIMQANREKNEEEKGKDYHDRFSQKNVGLHHFCIRAKNSEDVDKVYLFLKNEVIPLHGGKIVHAPMVGDWAPGYYSLLFEDPDGIRLEINYIPGKGLLGHNPPRLFGKL